MYFIWRCRLCHRLGYRRLRHVPSHWPSGRSGMSPPLSAP